MNYDKKYTRSRPTKTRAPPLSGSGVSFAVGNDTKALLLNANEQSEKLFSG